MEEKERYELTDNDCIIDNEKDVAICDVCDVSESSETLVNLLNQQDKEIKELKKENQQLKIENGTLKEKILIQLQLNADNVNFMENQRIENQQLKQLQKQLAIEELEKIKNYFDDSDDDKYNESEGWIITNRNVVEYVNNQIKQLKEMK